VPCLPARRVAAEEAPPPGDDIVVYGRALPQIGTAISGSQGVVGYQDFENKPLSRVGELVENVPGVIATQHSGTGKANQYFLRGFNLDHGTDFAGFVDGVPVNMRTHGHGQGYLDLNFLIPELVERIDYRKGPYFADVGDFSAAGTVQFTTASRLARPIAEATVGMYGYYRALAAGSAGVGNGDLLVAIDGTRSNGPGSRRGSQEGERTGQAVAGHEGSWLEPLLHRLSRHLERHRSGARTRHRQRADQPLGQYRSSAGRPHHAAGADRQRHAGRHQAQRLCALLRFPPDLELHLFPE
jgi:outer membrane cobalamin receptor